MNLAILQLTRSSGAAAYTYELCEAMLKSGGATSLTVHVSIENPYLKRWSGLPIRLVTHQTYAGSVSGVRSVLTRQATTITQKIIDGNPDLVLQTAQSVFLSAPIQRKLGPHQIPFADIVHDPDPHPDRWALAVKVARKFWTVKPDVVVGFSEYSSERLRAYYPGAKVVASLHGAYKADTSTLQEVQVRKVVEHRSRLLFFGRIEAYKGLHYLVEAYRIAKEKAPNIELTIAGRGPIHSRDRQSILDLGITLKNQWLSDNQLDELIAAHGVIVLPYTSATQSGPAAIAMARGMPCIGTDVGALPEQIVDGTSGLIVEPKNVGQLADAMIRISEDSDLVERLSQGAFGLSLGHFSWNSIASRLIEDLAEAVAIPLTSIGAARS